MNSLQTAPATRLSQLNPGQEATISAIHAGSEVGLRLAALGFRIGKRLRVMRRGFLSGPLHIRLGTTDVIIRRQDALQIHVAV
ncbi:hypothetical protein AZSI13_01930 [Azospira sp. I13]|uniref:FeoA family protein n=1 Tax=Azospira sp. I13 TaxID=1765050 RepID=UPI000D49B252|nr:FeoA family protein [Azospira sp. I13]GBG00866.1 hypothetical protein AZSI13_01930 [Azospira sp. I13]